MKYINLFMIYLILMSGISIIRESEGLETNLWSILLHIAALPVLLTVIFIILIIVLAILPAKNIETDEK